MRRLFTTVLLPTLLLVNVLQSAAQSWVRVEVDPRIELMSVVQVLTNYMLVSQHDSLYKREVEKYFAPHKNHQAIRLYVEMGKKDFNFDAVPKIFISLSEPPELKIRAKLPETAVRRAGGREKLDEFITALNDFARVSKFQDFYREHQPIYKKVLANNRASIEKAVSELSDYSGMKLQGSTVVLGMLLHDGGFAATIENSGKSEIYSFIGPVGLDNELPDFGTPDRNVNLVAHEFSHSFVNSLTTKYLAEINGYSALYEPIAERMKGQAYPIWEIAVNEHIARAITSRLTFKRDGAEAGEKALQKEEQRGFKYVRALAERLKEYESNRQKYPSLAEFYPSLIKVFEATNAQQISNPSLREELLKRLKADQDIRNEISKVAANGEKIPRSLSDQLERIDKGNTVRMQRIVQEYGWPGKSMVAADGAHAAFLLVQHADKDLEFQKKCLKLLERAVEAAEASPKDYAYLMDRVRVAEGKPQVYGTQMKFINGKFGPAPIEDEANVDKRRAAVGLGLLADYIQRMKNGNK